MTPEDEAAFGEFVEAFRKDALPKIADSAFTLSLVPGGEGLGSFDVKFAVELGAAIMLDKPIVALAINGRPAGLARVAHEVIEMDHDIDTEAGRLELDRKLTAVFESLGLSREES